MEIKPYNSEHLLALRLQPAQLDAAAWVTPEYAASLECPNTWTVTDGDEVLFCGGAWTLWPGRCVVWAMLAGSAGRIMPRLTRATRRYLALLPERRIECYVDAGFDQGARWASLLGFTHEATMRAFLPNGNDAHMFVRVR